MIPLRDRTPSGRLPLVTYLLIAANALVFWRELAAADPLEFVAAYALIPVLADLGDPFSLAPFVTAMFLHAGWLHLLSNMWFLFIFADNLEERLGAFSFLLVYLLAGLLGNVLQYVTDPGSPTPLLGASGAVAGVLGGYLLLFPAHRIDMLIPLIFYFPIVSLPAVVIIGYWFLTQVLAGAGSLGLENANIAFFAHIGGFIAGIVLTAVLAWRKR